MVDVGDRVGSRVVGDLLGGGDASDASRIDLHVAERALLDEVDRHRRVVRALAAGEAHLARDTRERPVRRVGVLHEGLLEPGRLALAQDSGACRGRLEILAEDGAGVDEQDPVVADRLARREHLLDIVLHRAPAERTPAELDGPEARGLRRAALRERLRRRVAEERRCVGRLRVRALVSEQLPDGRLLAPAEQVPERDVDAREQVIGLQQVEALRAHEIADVADVRGVAKPLAEHRRCDRLARAVRHRADERRDRGEGSRLALAVALEPAGADAHEQRVLAAVADVEDLRHREVEQLDRLNLHWRPRGCGGSALPLR